MWGCRVLWETAVTMPSLAVTESDVPVTPATKGSAPSAVSYRPLVNSPPLQFLCMILPAVLESVHMHIDRLRVKMAACFPDVSSYL